MNNSKTKPNYPALHESYVVEPTQTTLKIKRNQTNAGADIVYIPVQAPPTVSKDDE